MLTATTKVHVVSKSDAICVVLVNISKFGAIYTAHAQIAGQSDGKKSRTGDKAHQRSMSSCSNTGRRVSTTEENKGRYARRHRDTNC